MSCGSLVEPESSHNAVSSEAASQGTGSVLVREHALFPDPLGTRHSLEPPDADDVLRLLRIAGKLAHPGSTHPRLQDGHLFAVDCDCTVLPHACLRRCVIQELPLAGEAVPGDPEFGPERAVRSGNEGHDIRDYQALSAGRSDLSDEHSHEIGFQQRCSAPGPRGLAERLSLARSRKWDAGGRSG